MQDLHRIPAILNLFFHDWTCERYSNRLLFHCPETEGEGTVELRGDPQNFFLILANFRLNHEKILHTGGGQAALSYFHNLEPACFRRPSKGNGRQWGCLERQFYLGVQGGTKRDYLLVPKDQQIKSIGLVLYLDWAEAMGYEAQAKPFLLLPQEAIVFPFQAFAKMEEKLFALDTEDPLFIKRLEVQVLEFFYALSQKTRGLFDFLKEGNQEYFNQLVEARHFLDHNWLNPPSVNELAKQYFLNKNKLQEGFKKIYQKTVYEVITEIRMQHAMEEILETDRHIEEIANRVGYGSRANFYRNFKKFYGMTPIMARERLLKPQNDLFRMTHFKLA